MDAQENLPQITLNLLAQQELSIYSRVTGFKGTIAEVYRSLKQEGIFEEYRFIFNQYVVLSRQQRERHIRNEALKRALFLSWYSEVEPAAFTGLPDLNEDEVTEVYTRLNMVIERGWLSPELAHMLRHYARWEWIPLQYTEGKIHAVTQWIKNQQAGQESPADFSWSNEGDLHHRGLMGLYWQEQLAANN